MTSPIPERFRSTSAPAVAAASPSFAWNGPVCATCHRGYIGAHTCNPDDLRAIVARLQAKIAEIEEQS